MSPALRTDFQKHLERIQMEMPFDYIRMHGLFREDMMVYREHDGKPIYNWQYVDLVYDHWLSIGIRPFVELGFMPYDMASGERTVFWWKGNVTAPTDWGKWEELVRQFTLHAIERYGIEEVCEWYFEVWNEPNLAGFWEHADFEGYMKMYELSAKCIKGIDEQLRVGGPASSGTADKPGVAPWGEEFLKAVKKRGLPLDFFSTHPYPTFHPVDLEGRGYMQWGEVDRLQVDLDGMNALLKESGFADVERHLTEWGSSPSPRDRVHDCAFQVPFVIQNNLRARGKTESLSFWVCSDIFEEGRQGDTPFHGGFGMTNVKGLKKCSYHGYWFLSQLGELELDSGDDYIVTRHSDGTVSVLMWNYAHYKPEMNDSRKVDECTGAKLYDLFEEKPDARFKIALPKSDAPRRIETVRFDREHGSVYDAWLAMGAPAHILPRDLEVLEIEMEPELSVERLAAGTDAIAFSVPAHGAVLVNIAP